MDRLPSSPGREHSAPAAPPAPPPKASSFATWLGEVRNRLISGIVFTLPIVITFWIVYWIFLTFERFMLNPLAGMIHYIHVQMKDSPAIQELGPPDWWYNIASPVLALILMLATLYFLGLLFRSWVYRMLDWFLLHVPIVATIYRAVRNVVASLGTQLSGGTDVKRVVLVPFPHAGARSLGLVTNSLHDATTGRTILTVCVLTGVMPPAGFTLFVPEDSVTNIAWSMNDTLQAIVSGGMSAPPTIHFFEGLSTPITATGGHIVDARGAAIQPGSGE
jgi:uncharacterized membrane protein